MTETGSMIGRVLLVIDACLSLEPPVPLQQLAHSTGLPKATTWRIAQRLVKEGLLQVDRGGYTAGPGLVERGARAAERLHRQQAVTPELIEFFKDTGGAVWVVDVRSPSTWLMVASVYDRRLVEAGYTDAWLSARPRPEILVSALGIVALANRPDVVSQLLASGVRTPTLRTRLSPDRLHATMARALKEDHITEQGCVRAGWSCLAVPIRCSTSHDANPVAVLGIVERTPRFNASRLVTRAHAAAKAMAATLPAAHSAREKT